MQNTPVLEIANREWHLSKTFSLSIIAAMVFQGLSVLWWASQESFQIGDHEKRITRVESSTQAHEIQLARIEEIFKLNQETLREIKSILSDLQNRERSQTQILNGLQEKAHPQQ